MKSELRNAKEVGYNLRFSQDNGGGQTVGEREATKITRVTVQKLKFSVGYRRGETYANQRCCPSWRK